MATSLLALLDDIVTVLDDVTAMTKVAARRTAGVLGDDLALNAEQVSGVRAERELPVVWAVFKGSARNKLILVPAALLLAAFAPVLITPLLMLGGAYLCYEGFEKIAGHLLHSADTQAEKDALKHALRDPKTDLVEYEAKKIRGAIRTDLVLSAEIIVIAMGTVQEADFITQVFTVILIAVLMTVGVYGLVAAIVKLDDAGLYLLENNHVGSLKSRLGQQLLNFSPYLMKTLTVVGTAAMFLVGGGILAHGTPGMEHLIATLSGPAASIEDAGWILAGLITLMCHAAWGIICGGLLVPVVSISRQAVAAVRPGSKQNP